MARYLITQSLLSAWAYTFDCYEGGEDEAREDFIRTLRRESKEATEAMRNGIEFENLVNAIANGSYTRSFRSSGGVNPVNGEAMGIDTHHKWYAGAKQVADIIQGAPVQVKASRDLNVAGMDFLVYGILDSLKAGTIYDVKFTNTSLRSADIYGKYLTSAQHPAYFFLVPEARDFKYLVSDGEDMYIECYTRENTRFIGSIIEDFIDSISSSGLLDLYKEHWLAL